MCRPEEKMQQMLFLYIPKATDSSGILLLGLSDITVGPSTLVQVFLSKQLYMRSTGPLRRETT